MATFKRIVVLTRITQILQFQSEMFCLPYDGVRNSSMVFFSLMVQRLWYQLSYMRDGVYKRPLAANWKE